MNADIRVCPVTLDDAEVIFAIQARNGLSALPPTGWRQFWTSCPFQGQFADVPLGWLLKAGQQPVGVLGNVHMLYDFDGSPVKAGITTGWAVDPGYRNGSIRLLNAYFRQKRLDLWLVDSAAPNTSRLLALLKMQRIPAFDYDAPLLWPIRTRAFALAGLRRRGVPAAELLSFPLGAALQAAGWFRFRNNAYPKQVHRVESFDNRFDSLWNRIRTAKVRLRAVRTSSILKWRFQFELADGSAIILVHGTNELQGYAVLLRNFRKHLRLTVLDVADLQAVDDHPDVLRDLLIAAMDVGREVGAEALKFAGGQGSKRTVALSLRPYSYRIDCWQLFFKTSQVDLSAALESPDSWDISFFETF